MSGFQSQFPGAFAAGQIIFDLAQGCYAYQALVQSARDHRSAIIVPDLSLTNPMPVGTLIRKDGSKHVYDITHYLRLANDHPFLAPKIQQSWFAGALIMASDLLKEYKYFDRGPEIELIYHLRNGIAHGNIFRLTKDGKRRLERHPGLFNAN